MLFELWRVSGERGGALPEVTDAFRQVQTEVSGPVFAMRCVDHARHLEVRAQAEAA